MSDSMGVFAPFTAAANDFGNYQFELVKTEHFIPAVKEGIVLAKAGIEAIKSQTAEADFENTIVALEQNGLELNRVVGLYFTLLGANGTPEMHELAAEISTLLSSLESDISLDAELFARIRTVWEKRDTLNLDAESARMLESVYKSFARNGAQLPADKQAELRQVDEQLAALGPAYQQNLLKDTNAWELHLTDESDLLGLPESVRQQAAHAAKARGKESGWLVTLQAPSMVPFLQYSQRRELRETVWRAFNRRAFGGENDNQDLVRKIVALRHKRANLLGYKGHADYVLEERMAEKPESVMSFLDRLLEVSRPAAERDTKQVADYARKLDGIELMGWDFGYYSEKLKKELYDFDEEVLRAYFPLDATVKGMFTIAGKLYKLDFKERTDLSVYHEEVRVFEVSRLGEHIGLFYMDLHPRDTKQGGAWATSFRSQGLEAGSVKRPHIAIVCNFTPSTPDRPSLLRMDEVRTLFHEFGHALHGLLSDCTYQSMGGTSVYWDFVELPSQIMENWVTEKEALDLFARHHETGEAIPAELVEKMKSIQQFNAGYMSLRQLNFGYLDMAWHLSDPGQIEDLAAFEKQHLEKTSVLPKVEGTLSSTSFAHIFAGGYSSGYYSYKWAEVLDADAFEKFQEDGIFNEETAESFRANVLSRGNSAPPMDLYVAFRGRQPDADALLRRDGLL
jgi:peptidyl-dipeptidase Dcp